MFPVAPPTPSTHRSHRVTTQFFWARIFVFSEFLVFVLELTWFMVRTRTYGYFLHSEACMLYFFYRSLQRSQYVRTYEACVHSPMFLFLS